MFKIIKRLISWAWNGAQIWYIDRVLRETDEQTERALAWMREHGEL